MHTVYTERHRVHGIDQVSVEGRPSTETYEVPARPEAILDAVQSTKLGSVAVPADHGLGRHDTGAQATLSTELC